MLEVVFSRAICHVWFMNDINLHDATWMPGRIRRGGAVVRRIFAILEGVPCFIAGGFARYACSPHPTPVPAGDIDLYCLTPDAFEPAQRAMIKAGLTQTKDTTASLSFRDKRSFLFRKFNQVVQVAKPIVFGDIALYGEPLTVLSGADFSVTRVAIINPHEVVQHCCFEDDELRRQVSVLSIPSPVEAIYRLWKYTRAGYRIPAADLVKVLDEWESRPVEYKETIRDLVREAGGRSVGAKELLAQRVRGQTGGVVAVAKVEENG